MDGKSRPGRAAPYDSQAASRRLSAALVVAPLLMAVHGVLLLRASDHGPLSWFLVAIAAVTGLIGTRFGNSERVVLGQALVLFGVAA